MKNNFYKILNQFNELEYHLDKTGRDLIETSKYFMDDGLQNRVIDWGYNEFDNVAITLIGDNNEEVILNFEDLFNVYEEKNDLVSYKDIVDYLEFEV